MSSDKPVLFTPARLESAASGIRARDRETLAAFAADVASVDADNDPVNEIFAPVMQCDALVGALCDAIEPTLFGVAVLRTMRRIAVVQTDYVVPPAFTTWPHMVERVLSMIRISNTSASTSASDSVPADLRLHAITLMERLVQPAALLDSLPALRVELFPTLFLALEDILASDALLDEAATSLANREAAVFLMILFRLSSSKFSAVLASDFLSPQHNVVKCVATFLMRARDRGRIAYRLGRDATFLDMFSNPLSAATMCCWGIAENGGVAGAAALLQEGIIDLYVHALEQADDHSDSWTIFVKSGFRMISNAARHAVVAQHLRASTLPRSLERFRFGDANQGARVQGEAIHAIFLKSFLFGRDEASKSSAALLQTNEDLAVMLYNVFASVVDEKPLDGMWLGEFGLSIILSGINALSVSDGNKATLARLNFIPLVARVLDRFACNMPPIAQCGGGGADVEVAEMAVDFLLQMSFFFATHAEMHAVYVAHADLERILTAACQPAAGRAQLTPAGLKTAAALLSSFHVRLVRAASSGALLPSSSEGKRQHVMLSYAWGARKDLCVALVADLRAHGFEVWRDEDGSALVPFMQGATDDIMAEAVEASYAVIVCVSKQYKQSSNCRMEAKYANDRFKRGRLRLLYVMMDEQYTTRSEADCVDGWLGIMLGDALWYPLWSEACVAPTAKALASVIGTNAQSAQSAQMAAASSPPQLARSITVSSASSVDPPALMRAPTAAATKAALTRASTIACGGSSSPVAHGLSAEAPSASFSASRTASRAMTGLLASAAASTHATSDETASCASFVADVTTPVAHSLLNSDGGGSSTSGSVGEARNLVLSPGAQRSSVKTATHTPLADSHSAATGAALTSAAVPCDALERAFRLVQSASKVADAAGVAALCERLGLSEAAELAWLSAEDEAALVDLLRPLPARAFRQSLHEHRVRVQSPGAERAWALLTASANQNDARNIARWLLEFGVASDGMLVHADPTQVRTLADCLKPVPRAMFLHALGAPQML